MPEKAPLGLLEIERLGGVFREDLGIVALYETKRGTFRLLKWHFTVVEISSMSHSNIFLPLIDDVRMSRRSNLDG